MGKIVSANRLVIGRGYNGAVKLDDGRTLRYTLEQFGKNWEWDRSDGAYGFAGTKDEALDAIRKG